MMVFFLTVVLLCSLCEAAFKEISQPVSVKTLKLGDSVTIECYIKSIVDKRVWYKLTTGRRLQLVATYNSRYNRSVVSNELNQRYSVNSDGTNNHLIILAASWDDAGTYFCGILYLNEVQFGSGTLLMLKGLKLSSDSVIQQPVSRSIRSEDSLTLSCTVHSAWCTAENTEVMWLKNSQHSGPEMIHLSGKTNNSCKRTESGETICVHKLLMKNISSDHAGTYYCVATVCGQILFGNGTMIVNSELSQTAVVLIMSNIIFGIATLLLSWMLCKTWKKSSAGAPKHSSGDKTTESVIYSDVSSSHRRHDCRPASVIYSTVVHSDIRS